MNLITHSISPSFPGADKIVLWAVQDMPLKTDNPIKDELKGKERKKILMGLFGGINLWGKKCEEGYKYALLD